MWAPVDTLGTTMHRRVCPLYTLDNARRVHVIGSAVPFRVGTFSFLITATHVLLPRGERRSRNVFTWGSDRPKILSGRRITWEYRPGAMPDIDLALVELTPQEAGEIEEHYQFATPANTSTVEPKTPGVHYIIAGYPAARNRFKSLRFYPSAMATHLFTFDVLDVEQLGLEDKFDASHFAISLPYETVPAHDGGEFRVPKAAGMSGGGVWKTFVDIPRRLATTPQLVGIGIEHHRRQGLFVGTKIQQVIPLLRDLMEFVAADVWPEEPGA